MFKITLAVLKRMFTLVTLESALVHLFMVGKQGFHVEGTATGRF